jgi:hypothetical protein
MFVPFMLPQVSIIATVVLPVFAHVFKQISPAGIDQNQRNVAVFPLRITELVKATIAMIGPITF